MFDALERAPHSEPVAGGTRVTVRLPVTRAAAQMVGHYPGFPIMPGVLLLDTVRQAAAAAVGTDLALAGIGRARFTRPLLPGDELHLSLLISPAKDGRVAVRAAATRADGLAAAQLSVTLQEVADA
ncbi:hypothetical protein DN069_12425 [Streptacidiphilus pinicola]|uniref:ApeI dehydratase-like domain-containing protein n=1 Tax=Streptacidiphilus pinicola TaxID=2219663 RepID=A0A2X0J517_9ACTN|nr:hypothetical protein DN069_12425 [Streptacidiphilus pinicola]